MNLRRKITQSAMWITFFVEPYGTPLPQDGNDRNVPFIIAVIQLLVCLILLTLVGIAAYGWLSAQF